jgi:hypothetical protein
MKVTRRTIDTTMTAAAVLILLAALPAAVYDTIETGRVYACQGKKRRFLDFWR